MMKNLLEKLKRLYEIYFETRNIEIIRSDFYSGNFISKEEMVRLFAYEIDYLTKAVLLERDNYNKLFSNFNLGTMRNYQDLEEKTIKSGRKY